MRRYVIKKYKECVHLISTSWTTDACAQIFFYYRREVVNANIYITNIYYINFKLTKNKLILFINICIYKINVTCKLVIGNLLANKFVYING